MPTPGIFKDLQFYIADSEPEKDHLVKLIKNNGGSLTLSHTEEHVIRIGGHDSAGGSEGQVDPQYIYECDRRKEVLSTDQFKKPSRNNPNKNSPKSAIQRRNPYTTKDKRILRDWVMRVENFRLRKGLSIFQILSDKHPQHTAESWQNHWSRYMEKNLSREEKKRLATGASVGPRESDNDLDDTSDQEPSSPSHGSKGFISELLAVATSLHANHTSNSEPSMPAEIGKTQGSQSKKDSTSEATTNHSREESPLFVSGHQQKEIESRSIVERASTSSEELLEKPDRRNIIRIKMNRKMDASSKEDLETKAHTEQMDVATASQEDVIDLTAANAEHDKTVPQDSNSRTEADEDQIHHESNVTESVHQVTTHQPSLPSSTVDDHDKDLSAHTISHHDRQSIPSYSPYGHDLNRTSVNSDNAWIKGHEQPKRKVDSDSGLHINSDDDDDGNSTQIFKRYKQNQREGGSDQTPPRHRTEDPITPSARASSEIPALTGHIITAFAAEEARHISSAMKLHTYKRIQDVKDQDHRRWLGDLRGLMMDSDKDAMQVLTTLRISSGDWDVARAFLMRLKQKNQPTRQSNSWSSSSRYEVLQRDREELTRLMWSQKDDNTLLKGTSNQMENLIERKGRNNTNARRIFLQNLS
ncbi:hypothetical protein K450DRAFT_223599 [Umbelopsis ramanniana AG]|uniref:DNA-binding protein RAP1 n=1 Tax=Umbelopsis ramanniana AG TaxID=1314678 RepID=A0AAD5HHW0_UMBRA|nr:uncharacterized protein K450DRAFT_223599 [Umbelopsis ramanniana AG]KAI8583424.1 hypothetical protein K450DRAFT_223599 [Umbelopsis ramanniana AG]